MRWFLNFLNDKGKVSFIINTWDYFKEVLAIIGTFLTVISATAANAEWFKKATEWASFEIIVVLFIFGLICCGIYVFYRSTINVKLAGDKEICIEKRDLFSCEGNVVIPVNCYFDTIVGHGIIAEKSIHGQFLKRFAGTCIERYFLDTQIKIALQNKDCIINSNRSVGKINHYPLGTIAEIEKEGVHYFLVAATDFDDENRITEESRNKYFKVLYKLVEYISRANEGRETYVPVIGTGHSRMVPSTEDGVRNLVQMFRTNNLPIKGIHIVLGSKSELRQLPNVF